MSKDIKPYLRYYYGQECIITAPDGIKYSIPDRINEYWIDRISCQGGAIQPILRKLESMTEEEGTEFVNIGVLDKGRKFRDNTEYAVHFFDRGSYNAIEFSALHPQHFHYLLSRGFDLFKLIEAGLAIDKETLK